MLFSVIGAMDLGDLDATPNYDEATDGSYLVFDLSNGMRLAISCERDDAVMTHTDGEKCITYHGRVAECERSILLTSYFGGDYNVEAKAPSRMS